MSIAWAGRILDASLGLLFLYAGIAKAVDMSEFVKDVDRFNLLPMWGVAVVALYLPWLEIIVGLSLLTGTWRHAGRCLALLLMLLFTMALLTASWRAIDLKCGCFGSGGPSTAQTGYAWLFTRNSLLMLGLLVAGWLSQRSAWYTQTREPEH